MKKVKEYKTPVFASVDGEAIREGFITMPDGTEIEASYYVMLQSDVAPPLLAPCLHDLNLSPARLTTKAVFSWLMGSWFNGKTIIGYYLNYDYENWLADLPISDYQRLIEGEKVQWEDYELWLVPKKLLSIIDLKRGKRRTIYDHSGYWQRSFIATITDQKVMTEEEMEIIVAGKHSRSDFIRENWQSIAEYNQLECQLLTRVATKLFDDIASGFSHADIAIIPEGKDVFSPGCLSKKLFDLIDWKTLHPIFDTSLLPDEFHESLGDYDNELTRAFPFSASFFGGRIESAECGLIAGDVFAFDIRSAYPAAMSVIPYWTRDDMQYNDYSPLVGEWIESRRAGMYLIQWDFPQGWMWYPFPYRSKTGNVFFPRRGKGWINALEVYALMDTYPEWQEDLVVLASLTIRGTEHQGAIQTTELKPQHPNNALFIKMYDERAKMKKAENAGEIALKLAPNAAYGKLQQQVGVSDYRDSSQLKYFQDFAASWTTAYCRASIWLAIAEHRFSDAIIAIQTDGVYSRVPLSVDTTPRLGAWESERLSDFFNIMPGVYQYYKGGKCKRKQRGWGNAFNFDTAISVTKTGGEYQVTQEAFVTRAFALHQHNKLDGCALQWIPNLKELSPTLASKRKSPERIVLYKKDSVRYPPKDLRGVSLLAGKMPLSKPYPLKFVKSWANELAQKNEGIQELVLGNEEYRLGNGE